MGSNNPENNKVMAGFLTYPSRSNEDQPNATEPLQPRQPRNLQSLLRFAMEATVAEDAPSSNNSELAPMTEERRAFFEHVLESLTVNVSQLIQAAIQILTDMDKIRGIQRGEPLPEDVNASFHNLMEYIDDIDMANSFHKLGGFTIFPVCFGSENEEVRARTFSVLAELCQNNPYCQERALKCGLLNILLTLVKTEENDALAKCVHAISCMSRDHQPACTELVEKGFCFTLQDLMACPVNERIKTKASFFVRYLCYHCPDAKEEFIETNLVKVIAEQLELGHNDAAEHNLLVLVGLVQDNDRRVLRQMRCPDLGLQNILEDYLKQPEMATDRFREEKDYCQELLDKVFLDCPSFEEDDEVVER